MVLETFIYSFLLIKASKKRNTRGIQKRIIDDTKQEFCSIFQKSGGFLLDGRRKRLSWHDRVSEQDWGL